MATRTDLPSRYSPLGSSGATTVVLFDLDGTLHDDPRVTAHYVATLEATLPECQGLQAEVEAVVTRQHPSVRAGTFVEPRRGLVLQARGWQVEGATDWEGRTVPVPADLFGRVERDGPLRYLGDLWQIIGSLAARRSDDTGAIRAAFVAAREHVNDLATDLVRLPCLDSVLERCARGRQLLLATNTPEELGRPLVERLALRQELALVRYDARKPTGCIELWEHAERSWGTRPDQVLVVGDNLWNDLLPLAERGCRTVHIDPLGTDPGGRWSDHCHPDLASFADALEETADDI